MAVINLPTVERKTQSRLAIQRVVSRAIQDIQRCQVKYLTLKMFAFKISLSAFRILSLNARVNRTLSLMPCFSL